MKAKPCKKQQKGNGNFILPSLSLFWITIFTLSILSFQPSIVEARGGHSCKHKEKQNKKVLKKLPQNKRDLFKTTMDQVHKDKEGLHSRKTALHDEIKTIMMADTFDEKAMKEKMKEMGTLKQQMKEIYSQAIITLAKQFNQNERALLFKLTYFGGKHGKSHKKGHSCPYHH